MENNEPVGIDLPSAVYAQHMFNSCNAGIEINYKERSKEPRAMKALGRRKMYSQHFLQ